MTGSAFSLSKRVVHLLNHSSSSLSEQLGLLEDSMVPQGSWWNRASTSEEMRLWDDEMAALEGGLKSLKADVKASVA